MRMQNNGASRSTPLLMGVGFLAACALLAGCGAPTGLTFPMGCGPRTVRQPVATAIPASAATPEQPLPIYGAPVADRSLTAEGGTVIAFAGSAPSSPDPLYVSTDQGLQWTHLPKPLPPVNGTLDPLALSPNGRVLAGSDGQNLYILGLPAPAAASASTWLSQAVQNVTLLAFDPDDSDVLAALGFQSDNGQLQLYESTDGGKTLTTHPLPASVGMGMQGQALTVLDGNALVAVGQGGGVHIFAVPLTPSAGAAPPQPPASATSPAFALTTGSSGTLYLASGGGLFTLPEGASAWTQAPLPSGVAWDANVYIAVGKGQIYVAADRESADGTLWRRNNGVWHSVQMPADVGFIGQPVIDGLQVWAPTGVGPVLIGDGHAGVIRTSGITAPTTLVASAAWRPTLVAAGWDGGLFFSANGGQTWSEGTPPGNPVDSIRQLSWTPDGGCVAVIRNGTHTSSTTQVYLSGDAGRSWWSLPTLGAGVVTSITESPPGSGVWWVTEGGRTPGLYRSEPGKAAWTKVSPPSGAPNPTEVTAAKNGVWWSAPVVGTSFGAWRVRTAPVARGLAAWWADLTRKRPPAPVVSEAFGAGAAARAPITAQTLISDPYKPSVVYNGLRRTVNGGTTWEIVPPGDSGIVPGVTQVEGLAFGPTEPGALLATEFALLRDDGTAWVPVWKTSPDNFITDLAPAGPGRFYVAVQGLGVIVVTDPQATWHTPPAPAGQGRWTTPAAGARTPPLTVSAASAPKTVYRLSPGGTLGVSTDGGKTFPTTHALDLPSGAAGCSTSGMGSVLASALAVSPVNAQRLYVGIAVQGVIEGSAGLWMSTNGGRTWERSGLPSDLSVVNLAASPGTGQTLYAVTYTGIDSGSSVLWRTVNGGTSWSQVSTVTGAVSSVATPTATEVLVGGNGRIWRSEDGGKTFSPLTVDVPIWKASSSGGLPVDAVLQVPAGPLLAATSLGLAGSSDGGRTWQVVSEPVGDPAVVPGGLHLLADGSVVVDTQVGTFLYRPGTA